MDPREESIYLLVLIAAAVLGIVLGYFIITIIRQQKKTARLHLEKMDAEIKTLERERTRIAADLHDDLGPLLSAIRFKINAVEPASGEDGVLIAMATQHIDDGLARIREIAFDLMPDSLLRKGLLVTLEEFISKTEKISSLSIRLQYQGTISLDPERTVHLYRMLLELIHNTVKHAQATELLLSLRSTDTHLLMETKDNGKGFTVNQSTQSTTGLGLKNLQSRAEVMGAHFSMQTAPGNGVHCLLEIPL